MKRGQVIGIAKATTAVAAGSALSALGRRELRRLQLESSWRKLLVLAALAVVGTVAGRLAVRDGR